MKPFFFLVALIAGAPSHADSPLNLKAQGILQKSCAECHSDTGSAARKFGSILDFDNLIAREIVVPGTPNKSKLIAAIESGDMPLDRTPLSAADIALLRDWVKSLAPAVSAVDTPASLLKDLRSDLAKRHPDQRLASRYFALRPGAGTDLRTQRLALEKTLNSLSWERALMLPQAVNERGTLWRIDLRDLGWTAEQWDEIGNAAASEQADFHLDETSVDGIFAQTETRSAASPLVAADWFVGAGIQPPLYPRLLKLPKTQNALESFLGVVNEPVARAGMLHSGVALHNRIIERHETTRGGPYWISYDFADGLGEHDIFRHPLDFKRNGGEIIFSLPNGLHGYMLVNAKGESLDEAPTEIVQDPARPPTLAVRNGVSCVRCHANGYLPSEDEVRPFADEALNSFGPEETAAVLRLYPSHSSLKSWFEDDNARYQGALKKLDAGLVGFDPITPLVR